jgi:hypothetical protein
VDRVEPTIEEPVPARTDISETCTLAVTESVVLQTARAVVQNPDTHVEHETLILLDGGSTRTYITTKLASLLKLPLEPGNPIVVNRFASGSSLTIETKSTNLELQMRNGQTMRIPVTVVDTITGNIHRTPVNLPEVHRITKTLVMADAVPTQAHSQPLEMLIGNDYWADLVTGERIPVIPGLYLLSSHFGWILSGRLPISACEDTTHIALYTQVTGCMKGIADVHSIEYVEPPESKHPDVSDLFTLEAVGIGQQSAVSDEMQAMANFEETVERIDGRYHVTFPFREGMRHRYLT